MKILNLSLKNFKGIKNFALDTKGGNVNIYGDNATGKTTLFDAFTWLLFDKDSQNRKDFEIKPLDDNGQPIHGLDHEVEAVLEITPSDGAILNGEQIPLLITLRKVYREKWTKKRGSATAEFTGHTTDYYIDGVPVKKAEYESRIASLCDENVFKLLTNPTYFNEQLHWQKRREILLQVCGDVSDGDVIASDKSLARLPEILQGRRLDDHRKVIQARRAEINKELEKIPVRIDEAERALPDTSGIVPEALDDDIVKLRAIIQEKQQELARIESGGEIAEKRRQLAEVEGEILLLRNEHRARTSEVIIRKQTRLNEAKSRIMILENEVEAAKRRMFSIAAEADRIEEKIRQKRDLWHQVNGQQLEYEQETVCPTCGQALPEEKLAEAREKALAAFNREKAERLEQISAEGKTLKAELESLMEEHSTLVDRVNEAEKRLIAEIAETERIKAEIDALAGQERPVTENPAYVQKLREKEQIEAAISQLQANIQEAADAVRREIAGLQQAVEALEGAVLKVKQRESGLRRIEELKTQERELAAEYERLEQELYLTEQFTRAKVRLLEEKINSRFKMARFKLFNVLVNGGIEECCETLYQGVPYSSNLNAGHRIIVGMDIIRTLSAYYGFTAPIFVDNAESVTDLPKMDTQVIRLIKPEIENDEDRAKYRRLVVKVKGENKI